MSKLRSATPTTPAKPGRPAWSPVVRLAQTRQYGQQVTASERAADQRSAAKARKNNRGMVPPEAA